MVKFGYNFTKNRSYRLAEVRLITNWSQPPAAYLRYCLYQKRFLIGCWPLIYLTSPKILENCARFSRICQKFDKNQTSPLIGSFFGQKAWSGISNRYIICKLVPPESFDTDENFQNPLNISILECFSLCFMYFRLSFTSYGPKYPRIHDLTGKIFVAYKVQSFNLSLSS